jgi:hypothetical protein
MSGQSRNKGPRSRFGLCPRAMKHRPPRAAFTLAELAISTAIMGILMTGVASAILIASRALPDPSTPTEALLRSSDTAEQIASELYCALDFNERTATSVKFNVPDRNADLAPETIRYAWSGTPGDPLTRQYNGGTIVEVLADVREFSLRYGLRTATEQPDPVTNESAEYVLSSHDTPSYPADFAMTSKLWIGEYFFPSLPVETVEWKVTRVLFPARIHGGNGGIVAVQLWTPDASNMPGTTVLEETLMYESSLGVEYLWEEFSFSSVSGLSPAQGLCLVLAMNKKDANLADIQYDLASGTGLLTTSDAGKTWLGNAGQSMLYYVYGTATTLTTPDPITREWVRSVGIKLRAGADSAAAVETATQVLNEPEVTAP